jgi:DNA-binding transcriptional MerR regulator
METRGEQFTAGQVVRLTGVSFRQLDHWTWSGFLPPSGGTRGDLPGTGHARRYSFEDLVRIRAVGELRRQGVPLQVIRKALDRLQPVSADPLRELTLVAIGGEVFVCRSRQELERATDGQLAFTVLDLGAVLRQLEGRVAQLRAPGARPDVENDLSPAPSRRTGAARAVQAAAG